MKSSWVVSLVALCVMFSCSCVPPSGPPGSGGGGGGGSGGGNGGGADAGATGNLATAADDLSVAAGGDLALPLACMPPFFQPMTDSHNCGTCGNVCYTGACVAGACGPLAKDGVVYAFLPTGLASDGTNVYFLDLIGGDNPFGSYGVRSVPVGGGAPTTLAQGVANGTTDLLLDGDTLYWNDADPSVSQAGAIRTISRTGGAPATLASVPNVGIGALAQDATSIYFIATPFAGSSALYSVAKKGGGAPTKLATLTSAPVIAIATDGTNVYFSEANSVHRVGVGGGSAVTMWLAQNGGTTAYVTVAGGNVYFGYVNAPNNGCQILRMPVTAPADPNNPTAADQILITGMNSSCTYRAVTDGTNLYWGDESGMEYKMPLGGPTPTAIGAFSGNGGHTLPTTAIDQDHVYWTNYPTNGSADWQGIKRAAK